MAEEIVNDNLLQETGQTGDKWDTLLESGSAETKTDPNTGVAVPEESSVPIIELNDLNGTTPPQQPATEPQDSKWDAAIGEDSGEIAASDIIQDRTMSVDLEDYRGYLGPDILKPTDGTTDMLDQSRADNQSWYEQAGNFVGQAVVGEIVGGTIEGMGYLLDVGSIFDILRGEEKEWGNFITDFGQGIREGTQEKLEIYQDPSAEGIGKMADSGWWFSNGVSVASTLSMLIPTMGATRVLSYIGKGLAATKGMRAARKAAGLAKEMGHKSKWMTQGISQAVISRNIENSMEAHGTYEDQKYKMLNKIDPKTGQKFTEEEANRVASEAAASNWKLGWGMLAQDMVQYLSIGKVFNPISRKMVHANKLAASKGIMGKMKPWQQKAVGFGTTFLSEGGEESYQYMISERAKLLGDLDAGIIDEKEYEKKMSEALGSEEMMTSAFFGGLGGNLFQLAGQGTSEIFKSKKQRSNEAMTGKYYAETLKNQGAQMALLQQELNNVDQQDMSPATRKHVIDTIMMNMVGTALENDNYDQFFETMESLENMSAEDQKQFAEENKTEEGTGIEFNAALAKEYIPGILKTAEDMRHRYMKLRGKHGRVAASSIAKLQIENVALNSKAGSKSVEIRNIKEGMGRAWNEQASNSQKAKWERDEKGLVLARRVKALKSELASEKNPYKQKMLQIALDSTLETREQHKEDVVQARKDKSGLSRTEKNDEKRKETDNKAANVAYKAAKPFILTALEQQMAAQDKQLINNAIIEELGTEEGRKRIKKEKARKDVLASSTSIESIDAAIKDLEENKEDFSIEEKADITAQLEVKKKQFLKEADRKKKLEERKKVEEDLLKAQKEKELNNPEKTPEQSENTNPIGDNFEDDYSGEEVNLQNVTSSTATKNENEMAAETQPTSRLLNDTTDEWKQFINDHSAPKKGVTMRWAPAPTYEGITTKAAQALKDYEDALANGTPATQLMYDYLNIEMAVVSPGGGTTDVVTRIPNIDSGGKFYQNGYASNRKNAIDKMLKGEIVDTKIKYTQGGELNLDRSAEEIGGIPENIITDLMQIKGVKDVQIVLSNEYGQLMNTQKAFSEDFPGVMLTVNNDKPYRGGVFLVVEKADGTKFPLRLNFKKNTKEESTILADLIIDMAVPTGKRKTVISYDTLISDLEDHKDPKMKELYAKIKDTMGKEMDLLKGEATVLDMITLFVHVSDKKTNLERGVYWKNSKVYFGQGDGAVIDSNNRDAKRAELAEFLENTKRRQFNLNSWNNTPGYREYVISNGIINTDASTEGPLFFDGKEKGQREIKLHIEGVNPPGTPKSAPIELDTTNKEIPQELSDRMAESEKIGTVVEDDGLGNVYTSAVYILAPDAPRSKWNKTGKKSLPSYEDVLEAYQKEIMALPDKVKPVAPKETKSPKIEARKNPIPKPKATPQISELDKKLLDAELDYLEKTFGKEMVDVYFQGIETLPEKNQKELNKILLSLRSAQPASEVETNEAKIKELRDQEQNDLLDAIPNAEKYLTNGKVDKTKIKNKKDLAKFEKIYSKYDKLISPLMGEDTTPTQQTSEVKAKKARLKKDRDIKLNSGISNIFNQKNKEIISNITSNKLSKNIAEALESTNKSIVLDFFRDNKKDIDGKNLLINGKLYVVFYKGNLPMFNVVEERPGVPLSLNGNSVNNIFYSQKQKQFLGVKKYDNNIKVVSESQLELFRNNNPITIANKIRSEYDAKLAALEGTTPTSEKQITRKKIFDIIGNEEMGYDVMELTEDGLITDGQGQLSKNEAEELATQYQYDANKESQQSSDTQISAAEEKAVPLVDTTPQPAVDVQSDNMIKRKRATTRKKKSSAKGLFKDATQITENDMKEANAVDKNGKKC